MLMTTEVTYSRLVQQSIAVNIADIAARDIVQQLQATTRWVLNEWVAPLEVQCVLVG